MTFGSVAARGVCAAAASGSNINNTGMSLFINAEVRCREVPRGMSLYFGDRRQSNELSPCAQAHSPTTEVELRVMTASRRDLIMVERLVLLSPAKQVAARPSTESRSGKYSFHNAQEQSQPLRKNGALYADRRARRSACRAVTRSGAFSDERPKNPKKAEKNGFKKSNY